MPAKTIRITIESYSECQQIVAVAFPTFQASVDIHCNLVSLFIRRMPRDRVSAVKDFGGCPDSTNLLAFMSIATQMCSAPLIGKFPVLKREFSERREDEGRMKQPVDNLLQ